MSRLWWAALLSAEGLCGGPALTPRLEDTHAPRDFYAQVQRKEPACNRPVTVFPPGAAVGTPYKEMSSLSGTCSPGAIDVCEARMMERACELGAYAVILSETSPGPDPAGASSQSIVSRTGRAVRWE
jgi:hypothetical protein